MFSIFLKFAIVSYVTPGDHDYSQRQEINVLNDVLVPLTFSREEEQDETKTETGFTVCNSPALDLHFSNEKLIRSQRTA